MFRDGTEAWYEPLTLWRVQSAIPVVPSFARLPEHAVEKACATLMDGSGVFRPVLLRKAFIECEQQQPGLSTWVGRRIARANDDAARGFGMAMAMAIWTAFSQHFGNRIRTMATGDCTTVEGILHADKEMRQIDPNVTLESDDIIAVHQPEIAKLVRASMEETLATDVEEQPDSDPIDVDEVDAVYRMLLVEVLALSYAVVPLEHETGSVLVN
ncbi:MAG: hypothetical protein FWD57_07620 [Polyangiaceae bacterium]|nr:hypothetical protein [Polyangiaceae bacterium]